MKLAVFDIDGTLTLPYATEDGSFLKALESVFGFTDVDSDWNEYTDVTDSGLVHELCERAWGRGPLDHELALFRQVYCEEFLRCNGSDEGGEVPGASRFVEDLLRRSDWRVALATGNFRRLAVHKLDRGGIPWTGVPMATADDARSRGALVNLAVSRAEIQYGTGGFDFVVSVGDAPWDLRTARELEVPFLAVGDRCQAPARATIRDYLDVRTVLSKLAAAECW